MNNFKLSTLFTGARAVATYLSIVACPAFSQGLPPIYDHTPSQATLASTVAEFKKGTFLENLAIAADGVLYVNSYLD